MLSIEEKLIDIHNKNEKPIVIIETPRGEITGGMTIIDTDWIEMLQLSGIKDSILISQISSVKEITLDEFLRK